MATKKELTVPKTALSGATARAKQTAQRVTEEKAAAGRKKDSKDYMRIDLKPNGVDLKDYVIKQAAKESAKLGKTVSATKYIQDLIEADMNSRKQKDRRGEIADLLKNVSDKDMGAIETIVKALCK